jgi:hypothetical protein
MRNLIGGVVRIFLAQGLLRSAYAVAVTAWICGLLFVQWLLFMTPSALRLEGVTKIPFVDLSHRVRAQISKPLSPPSQ